MDSDYQFPGSPGGALLNASPERVNQQRSSILMDSPSRHQSHSRDSSIQDKISAFNSLAFQGKQLERKTNDAALKRAMLGREEAESEMRRYREEKRILQREVEEGKERERRVAERLEHCMEKYGREKEQYANKLALSDKELRRIRKEAYKQNSYYVKSQEELKSARKTLESTHADLSAEKERSKQREEEAFAARYQLVGVQEELAQMEEKIKLVEQERDALRTVAKNEEVARIAAEGRIPLPVSLEDDEFASPKKKKSRVSLDMITRSAASEEELDDIKMLLEWEKQNSKRAHDQVEFLEIQCKLNCCVSKASHQTSEGPEVKKIKIEAPTTVFVASEGIFRAVSPPPQESPWISPAKKSLPPVARPLPPAPVLTTQSTPVRAERSSNFHARTPSCEPPTTALVPDINTSLLSLLDEPQSPTSPNSGSNTPVQESPVHAHTFHTISTTTRIPLANPPDLTPISVLPATGENSALSPTMTREQALAQIAERRGRARSLAQGTMTPRKQMIEGGPTRRDISAPAIRSGNVRGRSQARA